MSKKKIENKIDRKGKNKLAIKVSNKDKVKRFNRVKSMYDS